jgi:ferrous iron transport protein A
MPLLSELKSGQKASIIDISENDLSLKLMDMGCLQGEEIMMIGAAPLGDPIMFNLGSYILSLRMEEAENIHVKLID